MGLLDGKVSKLMLGEEIAINTGVIKGGLIDASVVSVAPGTILTSTDEVGVYLPFSASTKAKPIAGVVKRSLVNKPKAYPYTGDDKYEVGDVFDRFLAGEIALKAVEGVVPEEGQQVYITDAGLVTNTTTGTTKWEGAKFLGINDGALVAVRIVA